MTMPSEQMTRAQIPRRFPSVARELQRDTLTQ